MKLPEKKVFFYVIVLIVILIASFAIGFYLETKKETAVTEDLSSQQAPSVETNPEDYTKEQYVVGLGRNLESDNFGFSAQIRGKVGEWGSDNLKIMVGEDVVDVFYKESAPLMCMAEFTTDIKGETNKTSETYLDFSNMKLADFGEPVAISEIQKSIPRGADIVTKVTYDSNNKAVADLIVGFGCSK